MDRNSISTTTTTYTQAPLGPDPHRPQDLPKELSGYQCLRIEYNPTSEYKLRKGEKTGWAVICAYTSRGQKEMNAIYVGGLEERKAQGYGEWHSEEERIAYHGGFKDNLAEGWGRYTDAWTEDWPEDWVRFLSDSEAHFRVKYEGGFKNGYFHGHGVMIFRDKSRYEGTWREGRRWGYGKYTRDNGSFYEFPVEGALHVDVNKRTETVIVDDPHRPSYTPLPPIAPAPAPQPQVIVVQQPAQQPPPQTYVTSPPIPAPQPMSVPMPHEQQVNASLAFQWGHGTVPSPPQTTTGPPGLAPYPAVDIPARPTTPSAIPVQFTQYPPRPVTPGSRHGSDAFVFAGGVATGGSPGALPYPDGGVSGSPPGGFYPHM